MLLMCLVFIIRSPWIVHVYFHFVLMSHDKTQNFRFSDRSIIRSYGPCRVLSSREPFREQSRYKYPRYCKLQSTFTDHITPIFMLMHKAMSDLLLVLKYQDDLSSNKKAFRFWRDACVENNTNPRIKYEWFVITCFFISNINIFQIRHAWLAAHRLADWSVPP